MRSLYADEEWRRLERGEVITSTRDQKGENGAVSYFNEASAIFDRPPPETWSVITDFASRPVYSPGCKAVQTVRSEGNRLWLAEHIRVLLIDIRYTTINDLEPENGTIFWRMDRSAPHDIEDTGGSWQIAPLPDGMRTLVRYRVNVDTGKPVPRVIQNILTGRSLPKMIAGMRTEMEKRHPRLVDTGAR